MAIVAICSIVLLDTREDSPALVVIAVLINGADTEFSITVGAFKIAAVLVNVRAIRLLGRVFTGCVDIAGRASWSAVPLVVLHINTALGPQGHWA